MRTSIMLCRIVMFIVVRCFLECYSTVSGTMEEQEMVSLKTAEFPKHGGLLPSVAVAAVAMLEFALYDCSKS